MSILPDIPLGHTIPAHQAFGWCSYCPDRTPAEELAAWQTRKTVGVDELLAVIEKVRAFATRLEEFAENALKDDDRELYTAIAKDLRDRIDGPAPNAEDDA